MYRKQHDMTISEIILSRAKKNPGAVALFSPNLLALTYSGLVRQISQVGKALKHFGFGASDTVAVVAGNGPDMAVVSLAVASVARCAPLNPASRAYELRFFLKALHVKALIIEAGIDSPGCDIALELGIPVIVLEKTPDKKAGIFTLHSSNDSALKLMTGDTSDSALPLPAPDDIALLLHTSGTSALPKPVPLTHRNLCASAAHIAAGLALTPEDRCLNVMPLFHIHGLVGTLLSSLYAGAGIICSRGFYAPEFFAWLDEFQPTWYSAVPAMHQAIVDRFHRAPPREKPNSLRFVRASSSALSPDLQADLETLFAAPVIQAYGMTEASHQIASNPLPPGKRKPGAVGRPTGTEIAVISPGNGARLPAGERGEVIVRGMSITAGYLNKPETNRDAFIRDWFRTGDEGYLDADGYLYLTGRLKDVIIRGGENISPQAVEEVLLTHPAVVQALVFAIPDRRLEQEVGAAVVLHPDHSVSEQALHRHAALHLTDFSTPKRILIVDEIPTGATGKLNRSKLAEKLNVTGILAPDTNDENSKPGPEEPSAIQTELSRLWREVLKIPEAGIDTNFINLGGDSMLAMLLITRIREKWGIDILIADFFAASTISAQARLIELAIRQSDEKNTDQPRHLPHYPVPAQIPLSFVQERLWFISEYAPDEPTVNRPLALRLRGRLDISCLEQSLTEIVRRHDVLRSRIVSEAGKPRVIVDAVTGIALNSVDLGEIPHEQRDAKASQFAGEQGRIIFKLEKEPPFRAVLLKLGTDDYLLCLNMHHIAFDGWSEGVLINELGLLYDAFSQGRDSPLKALSHRYSDFTLWQRQWLQGETSNRALDYWTGKLEGVTSALNLPADYPRPAVRSCAGATVTMPLGPLLTKQIEAVAQREGVTLFMILLAAFEVLLQRYSEQDEFVVGCPTVGRNRVEFEPLIGVFINTLALRADLSGNPSFRNLLRSIKTDTLQAFAYEHLPFEKLVGALRIERDPSRTPLFQVMFELRNYHTSPAPVESLDIKRFDFDTGTAQQDLALDIRIEADGLHCFFKFSTELFKQDTIERMAGHYRVLLQSIAELDLDTAVSDLPMLTQKEKDYLLREWNDSYVDYPSDRCIHECFEREAAKKTDAIALKFRDTCLTYRQLNERANQLAHLLRELGVKPDTAVGICLPRSMDMIVAVLAVLKAGGCYVPLDPTHPVARQADILQDAGAPVLLTTGFDGKFPGHKARIIDLDRDHAAISSKPTSNPANLTTPDNLTYLIYTSGSTGKPKGVLITHASVLNYITFERHTYNITRKDCALLSTSLTWDGATDDIYAPLLSGGMLVIPTDEQSRDPAALLQLIDRHHITALLGVVPSLSRALGEAALRRSYDLSSVRLLISVGETILPEDVVLLRNTFGHSITLMNHFGCTECTGSQLYYRVADIPAGTGMIPVGRPTPNHQAYILDTRQNLLPLGIPGEICISGAGIARGYHRRPALSAERFISHPFNKNPGARLYRTGDRGRIRSDGDMEHLGRFDFQVKIRGHRIEPGEIEAHLRAHPAVSNSIVEKRRDHNGEDRLVAYLSLDKAQSDAPSATRLREFLSERLPSYMIPSVFVFPDRFFLTPNGKVDRSRLPEPDLTHPLPEQSFIPASNEEERKIIAIWRQFLNVDRIGIDDDFFDLGGHSLMGFRIIAGIANVFGTKISLRDLFEHSTPARLAVLLRKQRSGTVSQ